ncbi:hypothetical protein EDD11_000232, partial [Mortierella claussenii]
QAQGQTKKMPEPVMDMDKAALVRAMGWEHPTRVLNVGTINANVKGALKKEFEPSKASMLLPKIKSSLQQVVRLTSRTKHTCQRAIGQYIDHISIHGVDVTDRVLFDLLCPRISNRDEANDDNHEGIDEQEPSDNIDPKNAQLNFLFCLLNSIYSSKLPADKGRGSGYHVRLFIDKAKEFLPLISRDGDGEQRPYPASAILRSTASQLMVELKKHYRNGSKDLPEK